MDLRACLESKMAKKTIEILYEDKDVLAVNKPAGLVVHADGRTEEKTLADWILENYPKIKDVGEPTKLANGDLIIRPGIVHRIDRDTSGVLIIAKNQKTFLFLKDQFKEREVEKSYRAFVYGEVKGEEGIIDRPITRSRKDFRLWSAQRGGQGEGREAITEYKVLGRISASQAKSKGETGFSLLELHPKTGRTHQIRVHLKAINHPVVNDPLYAPKRETAFGFKRLALHAYSIKFSLPSGKQLLVEAPYPEDFEKAFAQFNKHQKS